jgi:peptidoglycan/LPS O-acetylase OafA/YrhL
MGAIRLFLALVVATDHTRSLLMIPLHMDVPNRFELGVNAGYAVMYFYVISGFLMGYVLKNNYPPSRAGTLNFYQARFIRIFSLYWPVMILALLLVPGAAISFYHSGPLSIFVDTFLIGMDWNWAFGISAVAYLGQSWTLGAELTFYALAPFILRSRTAMWSIFALSAATRATTVHIFGFDNVWTYGFFPATVLFFILGAIANDTADKIPQMKRPIVGAVLLAAVPLLLMIPDYVYWDKPRFWLSYICFAAALPSISAATKNSGPLNALGELSYPLYLTHTLVIAAATYSGWTNIVATHFSADQAAWVILTSALAAALVGAFALHVLVETRTANLMRAIIQHCSSAIGDFRAYRFRRQEQ